MEVPLAFGVGKEEDLNYVRIMFINFIKGVNKSNSGNKKRESNKQKANTKMKMHFDKTK